MKEIVNTKLISDYIKNNNLTKKEFCKQCNISKSTFYKIMAGKNYYLIALFKIAKKMGVKIHYLIK